MSRVATHSHEAKAPLLRRKTVLLAVAILVAAPVAILAIWTLVTLSFSYSSGERAGYMQKLSVKGWICKTWEGELAMQNLPGTPPEIFHFSVRDNGVAKQIQELEGEKVALIYQQHKGVPSSCFGETEYFVTGVKKVGP
jgi:hypothetical protein